MVDAADSFPYDSVIRETDLIGYDLNKLKETDLTSLDFYQTIMDGISASNRDVYFDKLKETSLTGDNDCVTNVHQENLTDEDKSVVNFKQKPSTRLASTNNTDGSDGELETADSICLSTDSGIINDKNNGDMDELTVKFQDFESDFFDTDCEATDTENVDDIFGTKKDMSSETLVKFQDIESDFFETDYEGMTDVENIIPKNVKTIHNEKSSLHKMPEASAEMNSNSHPSKPYRSKQYSQLDDIESDFFEEYESDNNNTSTPKKSKIQNKKNNVINSKKDNTSQDNQTNKKLLNRLTNEKDRRVSMTNSLLRATIDELERALTNSNTLLEQRDKTIRELRDHNVQLKKSLAEELESNSQLKVLVMEKDSVVSEKESEYEKLQSNFEKLEKEICNLRLYKLNNIHDLQLNYDPINLDNSIETDLLDSPTTTDTSPAPTIDTSSSSISKRTHSCSEKQSNTTSKCPLARSRSFSAEQSATRCTKTKQRMSKNLSSKHEDDKNSTELHATLQMKFMRDAFFYYMIGFHSDEQINAILAILDYGDKRQDFVLEAHKLKKSGKKFNVSKISTRGLTFVQDVRK